MKNLKSLTIMLLSSIIFLSCKDGKEADAEKSITNFSNYVDSVSTISKENLKENWADIENTYSEKKLQAQSSLEITNNNPELKNKLDKVDAKYEDFKSKFQKEIDELKAKLHKEELRSTLFVGQTIGDDMNFDWVNKNNILSVYTAFVDTVSKNKDNYSREDWDEVKQMYEALDTRKNTVEKEGLTSSDNLKIAKEKIRFSSIYTTNRMGAKSEENANAKDV